MTDSTVAAPLFTPDQKAEAESLLRNERKCVSLGGLGIHMGMNRTVAQELLEELSKQPCKDAPSSSWNVTHCTRRTEPNAQETNDKEEACDEVFPCTVFKLTQQTPPLPMADDSAMDVDKDGAAVAAKVESHCCVYAVSSGSEPLESAHERDMAAWRDAVHANRLPLSSTTLLSSQHWTIAPSAPVRTLLEHPVVDDRMEEDAEETPVAASTKNALDQRGGRKTKTTAANFFGAGAKVSSSSARASSGTSMSQNSNRSKASSKSNKTVSSKPKKTKKSTTTVEDGKENNVFKTTKATTTVKPKVKSSKADAKKVGTVDDFVGDVEESDDDDSVQAMDTSEAPVEDVDAPKRTKKTKLPTEATPLGNDEDNDDVDDEDRSSKPKSQSVVAHGAMDDFCTKTAKVSSSEQTTVNKRRRKKMVKKTTVDAKGYLHTEMQQIWEDIPSDEEEPVAVVPVKAKPKAKKPTKKAPMKQGNLMGFFKPKA